MPYPCPVQRAPAGTHGEPRRQCRSGPGQRLPRSAGIRIPGLPNKGSTGPSLARGAVLVTENQRALGRVAAVRSPAMGESEHVLEWLQRWYAGQCDGDWEHEWGVKIGTLDNPGWWVVIDLEDTDLEAREYSKVDIKRSETDWFFTRVQDQRFSASCGPGNLTEVLTIFREWVEGA